MSDDFSLITEFERHLDEEHSGFEVCTRVNGLTLYICFYLGESDFDIIPDIIPAERFNAGHNIHVGQLSEDNDTHDEVENILALMDDQDTVIFFCANEEVIKEALTFLNFALDEDNTIN